MSRSHDLFLGLSRGIVLQRDQGLDFEAQHILPSGWTLECQEDGYLFSGPWSDQWENTVWKMVRFLAYKSLVSLSCSGVGDAMKYELVSCMEHGVGFRAVFRSLSVA